MFATVPKIDFDEEIEEYKKIIQTAQKQRHTSRASHDVHDDEVEHCGQDHVLQTKDVVERSEEGRRANTDEDTDGRTDGMVGFRAKAWLVREYNNGLTWTLSNPTNVSRANHGCVFVH